CAKDIGEHRRVDRRCKKLCRTRRGAQNYEIRRGVRRDEQLGEDPAEPSRVLFGIPRPLARVTVVGDGVARAAGIPHLVGPQLLEVAGNGRLGRAHAVPGEVVDELRLGAHGASAQDILDERVPGNLRAGDHRCSSRNARSAFWAWRRFSASSHTTDRGPSIASAVISWPRYAGRQCSTIAAGAPASSASLTWKGMKGSSRSAASPSCPIETQLSVAIASAPATASLGEVNTAAEPPVVSAISLARVRMSGAG